MVRPCKLRRVDGLPKNSKFGPVASKDYQVVEMSVEEYETIRLIDYEKLTQFECSEKMHVARTTIQKIYDDSRFKIADSIINGKFLQIKGGNYLIYQKGKPYCRHKERRIKNMIIAIPTNEKNLDAQVSRNLARSSYMMFYNVDTKQTEFKDNEAKSASGGAGITAGQFIIDNNANVLLTPRCGENAYKVLNGKVDIYKSIEGTLQENIDAYTKNELEVLSEVHKGMHGNV